MSSDSEDIRREFLARQQKAADNSGDYIRNSGIEQEHYLTRMMPCVFRITMNPVGSARSALKYYYLRAYFHRLRGFVFIAQSTTEPHEIEVHSFAYAERMCWEAGLVLTVWCQTRPIIPARRKLSPRRFKRYLVIVSV